MAFNRVNSGHVLATPGEDIPMLHEELLHGIPHFESHPGAEPRGGFQVTQV